MNKRPRAVCILAFAPLAGRAGRLRAGRARSAGSAPSAPVFPSASASVPGQAHSVQARFVALPPHSTAKTCARQRKLHKNIVRAGGT